MSESNSNSSFNNNQQNENNTRRGGRGQGRGRVDYGRGVRGHIRSGRSSYMSHNDRKKGRFKIQEAKFLKSPTQRNSSKQQEY